MLDPPCLTQEQADELDAAELVYIRSLKAQGLRRACAVKPAVRLAGPLPQPMLQVFEPLQDPRLHHPLGVGRRWLS